MRPSSFTIGDYLALIESRVPSALISPTAFTDLREFAEKLPGHSTAFFGFECRLGDPEASADFLICFHPEPELGRLLLCGGEAGFPESLFEQEPWQRVRALSREWATPWSDLHKRIENIWLEFDLADPSIHGALPSVFFGCGRSVKCDAVDEDLRWVTARALPILQAGCHDPEVGRRIEDAIRKLPAGAYVFQVGAMLARQSSAVRICIRDISGRDIPAYLASIGWPGTPGELSGVFAEIAPLADRIDLDIDIGADGVHPKIGLEWYLHSHLRIDPRWDTFLHWLVERGLSTPEKSQALYDYPGAVHERSRGVVWPEYLRSLSAGASSKHISTVVRRVHHIKVVYRPDGTMEAKAYLAVTHSLLDTAPFVSGGQPLPQVQLAPVPQFLRK